MFALKPRLLLAMVSSAAFLALSLLIVSGRSFAFDSRLVLLFREAGDPRKLLGPLWFHEMMRDLTAMGSVVGLGLMMVVACATLWLCDRRRLALGLLATVASAQLASTLLKVAIGRERPDIVEHAAQTFTASFPSGHAFLSAAVLLSIAGFVGLASRRAQIERFCYVFAALLMLAIGTSRVYLGVHWPSDVLGGWLLGIAWSCLATLWFGRALAPEATSREARVLGRAD